MTRAFGRLTLANVVLTLLAAAAANARAEIPAVQHIVIIVQENRTPDNLFQGLPAELPGADIATSGLTSKGQTIPLAPVNLATTFDMEHTHMAFLKMYDSGKMDGADKIVCQPASGTTCPTNPAFTYVPPTQVAPYHFIAVNYGWANRMFQSNQGPSFPAHQFLISGTSQRTANSGYFSSSNPPVNGATNAGCIAPASERALLVGPNGTTSTSYPCYEHATLTDFFDKPPRGARPGITWRYYAASAGALWNAPNAIRHMCLPSGTPPVCTAADWTNGEVVLNPAQVLTDIQNQKLASLSWVTPSGPESDHPVLTDGSGPSWVASVVNAIGQSHYWPNTVIFIVWDDWGGWYDHVAPPIDPSFPYYENGFRVPLLVVSAYTPAGYVSQQTHTFGSLLKFVETAFTLPVVPPGDFADARADNLADFFNFTQPPRPFVTVPAPIRAEVFQHDKRPPSPPDTD